MSPNDFLTQHFTLITEEPRWIEAFLAGDAGASLIRLDGVVCWRCSTLPVDPAACLRTAMTAVAVLPRLRHREA